MDTKSTLQERSLRRQPGKAKWHIQGSSDRGQALVEALILFLFLSFIFLFLELQMKEQNEQFKKFHFSRSIYEKI